VRHSRQFPCSPPRPFSLLSPLLLGIPTLTILLLVFTPSIFFVSLRSPFSAPFPFTLFIPAPPSLLSRFSRPWTPHWRSVIHLLIEPSLHRSPRCYASAQRVILDRARMNLHIAPTMGGLLARHSRRGSGVKKPLRLRPRSRGNPARHRDATPPYFVAAEVIAEVTSAAVVPAWNGKV